MATASAGKGAEQGEGRPRGRSLRGSGDTLPLPVLPQPLGASCPLQTGALRAREAGSPRGLEASPPLRAETRPGPGTRWGSPASSKVSPNCSAPESRQKGGFRRNVSAETQPARRRSAGLPAWTAEAPAGCRGEEPSGSCRLWPGQSQPPDRPAACHQNMLWPQASVNRAGGLKETRPLRNRRVRSSTGSAGVLAGALVQGRP